jgi:hypothetical protein
VARQFRCAHAELRELLGEMLTRMNWCECHRDRCCASSDGRARSRQAIVWGTTMRPAAAPRSGPGPEIAPVPSASGSVGPKKSVPEPSWRPCGGFQSAKLLGIWASHLPPPTAGRLRKPAWNRPSRPAENRHIPGHRRVSPRLVYQAFCETTTYFLEPARCCVTAVDAWRMT